MSELKIPFSFFSVCVRVHVLPKGSDAPANVEARGLLYLYFSDITDLGFMGQGLSLACSS